jgi:hypothetical protein
MADSLDTKSYVAVRFGGSGSFIPLPMMPGSGATNDPALQKVFLAGGGAFEAVNFVRGLSQPMVDFIGIPHKSWFTAGNLIRAFITRTNGLLTSSNGDIAYRIGSTAGDEVAGIYTDCYMAGLTLAGGGRGTPIVARAGLLASGTTAGLGTLADMPSGQSGFFLSDGVTFGSTLTDVLGWTLTITNGLTPDTACNASADPVDAEDPIIPTKYLNGPIGAMLNVVQKVGATTIQDDDSLAEAQAVTIVLSSAEVDGVTPTSITFGFRGMKPVKSSQVSGGLAIVSRTYVNIATTGADSLTIA